MIEIVLPHPHGKKVRKVNDNDYGQLKMHCLNTAQAAANNLVNFTKLLESETVVRLSTMTAKDSVAMRVLTGPHPQYGSPDGKG